MSTQDPTKILKRLNCFEYPFTRMCSENTGKTLARLDMDVSCKFARTPSVGRQSWRLLFIKYR